MKQRFVLGLRQKDVAAQLGVNEWTFLCWENDKKAPSIRLWPRIIEFLGVYPFPAPQTLGERLIAVRRSLGLSRKRLAQRLSVDDGTLAKWELGKSDPREIDRCAIRRFVASVSYVWTDRALKNGFS